MQLHGRDREEHHGQDEVAPAVLVLTTLTAQDRMHS